MPDSQTRQHVSEKSQTGPAGPQIDIVSSMVIHFPVVAIGASPDSLEACTKLLGERQEPWGMAFIFVQHLHPPMRTY
jgi:chemotaxis response regulator CheB